MMHSEPMSYLHFRRVFSPVSETFIYHPVVALNKDVQQHVVCLLRSNSLRRPFDTHHLFSIGNEKLGAPGGELGKISPRLWEADRPLWPVIRLWLRRKIQQSEPSVIFAHFGPDACLLAPVASALEIPLVCIFYGYDVSRLLHQHNASQWRRRYESLFHHSSLIVGISTHICERLAMLGAPENKLRMMHLGVDLSRFEASANRVRGAVRLLHIGRLTPKKNPLKLLRAVASARAQLSEEIEVTLTIAGDGPLQSACIEEVSRLGLRSAVRFLGRVNHREVPELISRHNIYTQYCETAPDGDMEGLGVTFVEAGACGRPAVTTRHNGIPDVVLHRSTGLLSEEGDIQAFASNIVWLCRNPGQLEAMGTAARSHVLAEFGLHKQVETMHALARESRSVNR